MSNIPLVPLMPNENQLAQLVDLAIESGNAKQLTLLRDIMATSRDLALREVQRAVTFVELQPLRLDLAPDPRRNPQKGGEAIDRANAHKATVERSLEWIERALKRLNAALAAARA